MTIHLDRLLHAPPETRTRPLTEAAEKRSWARSWECASITPDTSVHPFLDNPTGLLAMHTQL